MNEDLKDMREAALNGVLMYENEQRLLRISQARYLEFQIIKLRTASEESRERTELATKYLEELRDE